MTLFIIVILLFNMYLTSIMSFQIVEMRVHVDCPGCERKITKALSKLDGTNPLLPIPIISNLF